MLIGFTGKAGVGKTTIAKKLQDYKGFLVKSFANPLKESLVTLTGLPMCHFTDSFLKEQSTEFGKTPRELMQLYGTEFVRNMICEHFWVIRMRQELNSIGRVDVVIDDVRFEDEAQLIRERGGYLIHLKRDFESPTDKTGHKSEAGITVKENDIVIDSGKENAEWTYETVSYHLF